MLQLRRRLHNGLTEQMMYTYSKSIDDASALGGQLSPTSLTIAQNWLNLGAERGLSTFDQRQVMNAQVQYTTGMGIGGKTLMSGWKGKLYKEWTLATQITVATGLPETPLYIDTVAGTAYTNIVRPDVVPGQPIYAGPAGYGLNAAAFTAPVLGQWGDAGRDSITGPRQFTLNSQMARTFRLNDRLNFDLAFSATNLLNHVTFASWDVIVNNPAQFGLPTAPNGMRNISSTMRLRF